MKPFADDAKVVTIEDLEIENGTSVISIHGAVRITRDKEGLKKALALRDHAMAIAAALEGATDLPQKVQLQPKATIDNPLG